MFRKTILATTLALALTPSSAFAAWVLDGGQSNVSFVSVKKGKVGEVHKFTSLSGKVSKDGKAKVEITLGSVETGIAIRNKRMGKMLFEIKKYPLATITSKIDAGAFKGQAVGSRMARNVLLTIDLHGTKKEIGADVIVTRLSKSMVSVTSAKPIVIKAKTFGLKDGVEALQKVAKLPSIATVVPTTFDLVFVNK